MGNKIKKKHIKALKKTEKEMKTNLPTNICVIDCFFLFFFQCMHGFYLIKYAKFSICFESRTETSMEALTSVCAVFMFDCMRGFS